MIPKNEITILNNLPIDGVAVSLGMEINKYHLCLCLFHEEKTGSMRLFANNTFYCYGCGRHGGVIDLVMRKLGVGFVEACKWLASHSNTILDSHNNVSTSHHEAREAFDASRYARYFVNPALDEEARQFLYGERLLNPKVTEWCRLASWRDRQGVTWLQIPYFDADWQLVGVQWRNLSRDGPRFRFPRGSRCYLYNTQIVRYLKEGEPLYVAEGCSDCWSLLSSGHKAIAVPSATMLTNDSINELRAIVATHKTELHIFPDNDTPGEQLYRQLVNLMPVVRHPLAEGCKDYSDYYLTIKKHNNYGNYSQQK